MRVAILSYEFPPATAFGGISTYSAQLADMLARNGHEVEAFVAGTDSASFQRPSGAWVHRLPCTNRGEFHLPAGLRLLERHREKPFDVVESPEYVAEALTALKLLPELPLVLRLHTPSLLIAQINTPRNRWHISAKAVLQQLRMLWSQRRAGRLLSPLNFLEAPLFYASQFDAMEKVTAQQADLICSPSRALVSYPTENWGVSADNCRHLPNMFDASMSLLDLPIKGRGCTLGFFGRLEERKGIHSLLQALPELAKRVPSLELCCVGQPCHLLSRNQMADTALTEACSRLGIRLHLPGKVNHETLHSWYARCRVAVFPSIWENFPYVCLEAMAAGCAVIGSEAGGMSDMILPGETGLTVPPNNPSRLAALCADLVGDPERSAAMGEKGRQRVQSTYSSEALLPNYLKTYEEAIQRRRRTGPRQFFLQTT